MEHTMHSHELPCSYVGVFQVFSSPADYRRWVSDDWDSENVDCSHLFLARELALQNPPHSVSLLRGGFAEYLFVIVAKRLQDAKVFVALVYVIQSDPLAG